MNSLATTGISWTRGQQLVSSKLIPTCMCVDGKARAQVYNMAKHNSHFECTYCTHFGVSVDTMRYPMVHEDLPPYEDRTHAGMKRDMIQAQRMVNNGERNVSVRGHKGITPLMNLKHFNLSEGNAFDDLHNIYECASKYHIEVFIQDVPKLVPRMGQAAFLQTIDLRLRNIKTPSCIARKPGTCLMKNRSQMHGTEWRNWLLYFAPVCLLGLVAGRYIQTLEHLSYATYLLSQDIIFPDHIDIARELTSLPSMSLEWIRPGAINQVVNRHLIRFSLELAINDEQRIAPEVKDMMKQILHKRHHRKALQVDGHSNFLGGSLSRPPTEDELRVLLQEQHNTTLLHVFKRMIINGVNYTTASYVKEESRSDDSTIYTFQNTFCTIQDIVSFKSDGEDKYGLLVIEHKMARRPTPLFPTAKHICEVHPDVGLLHFLRIQDVRSPVVKAPLLGALFFIPLTNVNEID
ncbi:Intercellular adhesion molecule 3 [Frankliniella fusca]|uniref:Intercellular adhesion molecule 3 n=1 Tax=Frankliniella fusca TaxID=407009 RepID=A0AAE1GZH7_9NEOP|nr:Intercellular adhesion molecule 3 [Frankliniella fusca]